MLQFMCSPIIWWCIFSVLIGWLLNSLFVKRPIQHTQTIIEKPIEKKVQVFVDRPIEVIKEVEVIKEIEIERIVEKPIEVIKEIEVEKIVEKQFDNPALLAQIEILTEKVSTMNTLRATIARLEARSKRKVTNSTNNADDDGVEDLAKGLEIIDNPEHLKRIKELEAEISGWAYRDLPLNVELATSYGFAVSENNELEIILGINPMVKRLLNKAGIITFAQLAGTRKATLTAILKGGGTNLKQVLPNSWPEQAAMAAQNNWKELRKLQDLQIGTPFSTEAEA